MSENYRKMQPPYMDMGFYFEKPDWEAYEDMYATLINLGGIDLGTSWVLQEPDATAIKFDYLSNLPNLKPVEALASSLFAQPDTRVLKTNVKDAIGAVDNTQEILEYAPLISPQAIENDWHPITVTVDGEIFFYPEDTMTSEQKHRAQKSLNRITQRFCKIAQQTNPLYAAIQLEDTLSSPSDLHKYPPMLLFGLYVSHQIIGEATPWAEFEADGLMHNIGAGYYIGLMGGTVVSKTLTNRYADRLQNLQDRIIDKIVDTLASD